MAGRSAASVREAKHREVRHRSRKTLAAERPATMAHPASVNATIAALNVACIAAAAGRLRVWWYT